MRYIVRKCDDGDTVTRTGKARPWSWDVVEIGNDGTHRVVANFDTRAEARKIRDAYKRMGQ